MLPGFAGDINIYLRESCREKLNNKVIFEGKLFCKFQQNQKKV